LLGDDDAALPDMPVLRHVHEVRRAPGWLGVRV
jgi:hypothetical protein